MSNYNLLILFLVQCIWQLVQQSVCFYRDTWSMDCGMHSIDLFLGQGCPLSTNYLSKPSLLHHFHASYHDKVDQNGQISAGWDIPLAMLIFICKVRRYVSPKTLITADVFYKLVAQMPSSCGSSIAPRDTYCPCRLLSRSSEISKSSGKKAG